jgi:hypothetical protein
LNNKNHLNLNSNLSTNNKNNNKLFIEGNNSINSEKEKEKNIIKIIAYIQ